MQLRYSSPHNKWALLLPLRIVTCTCDNLINSSRSLFLQGCKCFFSLAAASGTQGVLVKYLLNPSHSPEEEAASERPKALPSVLVAELRFEPRPA